MIGLSGQNKYRNGPYWLLSAVFTSLPHVCSPPSSSSREKFANGVRAYPSVLPSVPLALSAQQRGSKQVSRHADRTRIAARSLAT